MATLGAHDKADTGSAASGEVASTTTGGTTGSTATTTETTGGSGATTTGPTTTSATTEDTAATTMGGDASTHLESCEVACDNRYACFPDIFTSKAECIQICLDEAAGFWPTSECFGALGAFNNCIAGVTCEEITSDGCGPEADYAYNQICVGAAYPQCENSQGSAGTFAAAHRGQWRNSDAAPRASARSPGGDIQPHLRIRRHDHQQRRRSDGDG